MYCRVPARRGLQRTTRAATRHGARDPLVHPQVDQTIKLDNYLDKRNEPHIWFAFFTKTGWAWHVAIYFTWSLHPLWCHITIILVEIGAKNNIKFHSKSASMERQKWCVKKWQEKTTLLLHRIFQVSLKMMENCPKPVAQKLLKPSVVLYMLYDVNCHQGAHSGQHPS